MKKVYVDTSDAAEAKREKLNDNVIVAYDIHGDIVGIEVLNPVGLDIDDELDLILSQNFAKEIN